MLANETVTSVWICAFLCTETQRWLLITTNWCFPREKTCIDRNKIYPKTASDSDLNYKSSFCLGWWCFLFTDTSFQKERYRQGGSWINTDLNIVCLFKHKEILTVVGKDESGGTRQWTEASSVPFLLISHLKATFWVLSFPDFPSSPPQLHFANTYPQESYPTTVSTWKGDF